MVFQNLGSGGAVVERSRGKTNMVAQECGIFGPKAKKKSFIGFIQFQNVILYIICFLEYLQGLSGPLSLQESKLLLTCSEK